MTEVAAPSTPRVAVVSYGLNDSAAKKLACLRGGLDDVIQELILDHHIPAEDVQAWCFAAIDEAVADKAGK